jgi:membrane protease YdiL (CAAX protease family)
VSAPVHPVTVPGDPAVRRLRSLVAGSVPAQFFLLVLALSVPFWLLGAAFAGRSTGLPVNIPISAQMAVCPLVAALILLHRDGRVHAVLAAFRRAVDPRGVAPRWHVVTLLLMPAVMALSYGVMRLAGDRLPPPTVPWVTLPVLFTVFLVAALGEELGWMGYVYGPLSEGRSALWSSLLLGVVWAAWHVVPLVQAGHPAGWIAWQCLGTVARRVIIVWLYLNSGQNVFAAVLLHTMDNVSVFAFPVYGSFYDPTVTGLLIVAAAAAVTVVWTAGTLTDNRLRRTAPDPPPSPPDAGAGASLPPSGPDRRNDGADP